MVGGVGGAVCRTLDGECGCERGIAGSRSRGRLLLHERKRSLRSCSTHSTTSCSFRPARHERSKAACSFKSFSAGCNFQLPGFVVGKIDLLRADSTMMLVDRVKKHKPTMMPQWLWTFATIVIEFALPRYFNSHSLTVVEVGRGPAARVDPDADA